MDKYDALGHQPERSKIFSQEILAEVEDPKLAEIVSQAANNLSTPMAMVTMVLEKIQFFKAHYGLPTDLAVSRSTGRDVSFCQFVVRDGEAFEVENAKDDSRVPQQLVHQYGIRAYMGIPIKINEHVAGSLCVIDTKPRKFSSEDQRLLSELANQVSLRLEEINQERDNPRLSLTQLVASPGFTEVRESLELLDYNNNVSRMASVGLRSFIRLVEHLQIDGASTPNAMRNGLSQALTALTDLEEAITEIEVSLEDVKESVSALEGVLIDDRAITLSETLKSAQDLSRPCSKQVGGAPLPHLEDDPLLATKKSLAISIISSCLVLVSTQMNELGLRGGVKIQAQDVGSGIAIIISADYLTPSSFKEVGSLLENYVGKDPTVGIIAGEQEIQVIFSLVSNKNPDENGLLTYSKRRSR